MESHACNRLTLIKDTYIYTQNTRNTHTKRVVPSAESKRWKLNIIKFLLSGMLARRKWQFALWTTCARGKPCRVRARSMGQRETPCPLERQCQLIRPDTCGTVAVTGWPHIPSRRVSPGRIRHNWTRAARRRMSALLSRTSPNGCGSRVVCSIAVA